MKCLTPMIAKWLFTEKKFLDGEGILVLVVIGLIIAVAPFLIPVAAGAVAAYDGVALAFNGIAGAARLVKKARAQKAVSVRVVPPRQLPPPPPSREQLLADLERAYRYKLAAIDRLAVTDDEKRDLKTRAERDYLRRAAELMG